MPECFYRASIGFPAIPNVTIVDECAALSVGSRRAVYSIADGLSNLACGLLVETEKLMHGGGHGMGGANRSGWAQFIHADEQADPHVTRELLRRVARYAR